MLSNFLNKSISNKRFLKTLPPIIELDTIDNDPENRPGGHNHSWACYSLSWIFYFVRPLLSVTNEEHVMRALLLIRLLKRPFSFYHQYDRKLIQQLMLKVLDDFLTYKSFVLDMYDKLKECITRFYNNTLEFTVYDRSSLTDDQWTKIAKFVIMMFEPYYENVYCFYIMNVDIDLIIRNIVPEYFLFQKENHPSFSKILSISYKEVDFIAKKIFWNLGLYCAGVNEGSLGPLYNHTDLNDRAFFRFTKDYYDTNGPKMIENPDAFRNGEKCIFGPVPDPTIIKNHLPDNSIYKENPTDISTKENDLNDSNCAKKDSRESPKPLILDEEEKLALKNGLTDFGKAVLKELSLQNDNMTQEQWEDFTTNSSNDTSVKYNTYNTISETINNDKKAADLETVGSNSNFSETLTAKSIFNALETLSINDKVKSLHQNITEKVLSEINTQLQQVSDIVPKISERFIPYDNNVKINKQSQFLLFPYDRFGICVDPQFYNVSRTLEIETARINIILYNAEYVLQKLKLSDSLILPSGTLDLDMIKMLLVIRTIPCDIYYNNGEHALRIIMIYKNLLIVTHAFYLCLIHCRLVWFMDGMINFNFDTANAIQLKILEEVYCIKRFMLKKTYFPINRSITVFNFILQSLFQYKNTFVLTKNLLVLPNSISASASNNFKISQKVKPVFGKNIKLTFVIPENFDRKQLELHLQSKLDKLKDLRIKYKVLSSTFIQVEILIFLESRKKYTDKFLAELTYKGTTLIDIEVIGSKKKEILQTIKSFEINLSCIDSKTSQGSIQTTNSVYTKKAKMTVSIPKNISRKQIETHITSKFNNIEKLRIEYNALSSTLDQMNILIFLMSRKKYTEKFLKELTFEGTVITQVKAITTRKKISLSTEY